MQGVETMTQEYNSNQGKGETDVGLDAMNQVIFLKRNSTGPGSCSDKRDHEHQYIPRYFNKTNVPPPPPTHTNELTRES